MKYQNVEGVHRVARMRYERRNQITCSKCDKPFVLQGHDRVSLLYLCKEHAYIEIEDILELLNMILYGETAKKNPEWSEGSFFDWLGDLESLLSAVGELEND